MDIDFSEFDPWVRWAISGGIFLLFLGIAFASRFILDRLRALFAHRTKTRLDDLILRSLRTPFFLGLIVLGIWLAIIQVPEMDDHQDIAHKVAVVLHIGIAAMAVARVIDALMTWYGSEIASRTHTDIDDKLLPILRRVEKVVVYGIAFMIILDRLNVNISPLIAGLGLGGLAVALAIQPTLVNFLAGSYVTTDGVIRKDHYIVLDSGHEGFVEEIGWRITKIRSWDGNLFILPNSRLAEAIIMDFEVPSAPLLFRVACGVSYDSDLEKVERVSLEVAREVMQKYPEGAKDFEPVVRFKAFGDSNIDFAVVLKAVNRMAHFQLKSYFIKALHKRFAEEGIEIQYPARKLYFAQPVAGHSNTIAVSAADRPMRTDMGGEKMENQ